jgi:hypothetical protein
MRWLWVGLWLLMSSPAWAGYNQAIDGSQITTGTVSNSVLPLPSCPPGQQIFDNGTSLVCQVIVGTPLGMPALTAASPLYSGAGMLAPRQKLTRGFR